MLYYNIFKKVFKKKTILILLIFVLLFSLYFNKNNLILEANDSNELIRTLNTFEKSVVGVSENLNGIKKESSVFINDSKNGDDRINYEAFENTNKCQPNGNSEKDNDAISAACGIFETLNEDNENMIK